MMADSKIARETTYTPCPGHDAPVVLTGAGVDMSGPVDRFSAFFAHCTECGGNTWAAPKDPGFSRPLQVEQRGGLVDTLEGYRARGVEGVDEAFTMLEAATLIEPLLDEDTASIDYSATPHPMLPGRSKSGGMSATCELCGGGLGHELHRVAAG